MNINKSYLTIEEIANIVDEMLKPENENSYNREVVKVALVTQYCTDCSVEGMMGTEVYNMVAKSGMLEDFESHINNYYIIDKMVREDRSLENTAIKLAENINNKLDKFTKKISTKDLLKVVGEVKDLVSKSANI